MPEIDGEAHAVPTSPVYTPGAETWSEIMDSVAEVASDAARNVSQAAEQVGASVNSGSPGFAFDHDQLLSIADKWERLAENFRTDAEHMKVFQQARPPGNEYASHNNVDQIASSGETMREAFGERANYCDTQAEKFRRAAGEYQKADEEAKATVEYSGTV